MPTESPVVESGVVFEPNPGPQTIFLQCPYPFRLYGGARGGGKSFAIVLAFAAHVDRYGVRARGIVIRRSYPEMEQFHETCQEILPHLGYRYHKQERTWKHTSGAILKERFLETDADADKYQGHQYSFIGIEEAGNFKSPAPINKLKATLRSPHKMDKIFAMTANPGGRGHDWLKKEYIDPAPPFTAHKDPITGAMKIFIPARLEDNPALMENDPHYANNLLGTGPGWLVEAWRYGKWDISPGGRVFLREYWREYSWEQMGQPTQTSQWFLVVQSWDTAFKKTDESNRSACTTWGVGPNGYYLLDAWADKVEFPELKKVAKALYAKWRPHVVYIEDKASGQSLVQELKRPDPDMLHMPVKAVKVDGDKVARAYAVTPIIESGKVFIPDFAPWKHDYIEEMSKFPESNDDDYVDSTSQALDRLAHYTRSMEQYKQNVIAFPNISFMAR